MALLHIVKCKICNEIKRKVKLFVPKRDSFCKHSISQVHANKNIKSNVKKKIVLKTSCACQALKKACIL